jgi:hydroxymethylpyrimidine pyrophosphatase-like HAD family hydrolase
VSKGSSLQRLCSEHLNVELKNVAAFGDGDNDKEMLECAGIGFAMKNAGEMAKNSANVVIEVF